MKKRNCFTSLSMAMCLLSFALTLSAQQNAKPKAAVTKPAGGQAVFAVLQDGKAIEPIALLSGGKLRAPANGSDAPNVISTFDRTYYKSGTVYKLIFGGTASGSVSVKSSDPKAECGKNIGNVTTKADKTPLKGLIMGLATNVGVKNEKFYRRRPTADEKTEMDDLVRAEYAKEKLTPAALHYQNLTAIDIDHDGVAEFVGSYWVEVDKLTRGLLFFIASKGSGGKYSIGYKEYRLVDQSKVMSGNITAVDEGVYHELLLDSLDIDGDGKSEIFTYEQAFEGAGFRVYKKSGAKWTRIYEFSNYHCAY